MPQSKHPGLSFLLLAQDWTGKWTLVSQKVAVLQHHLLSDFQPLRSIGYRLEEQNCPQNGQVDWTLPESVSILDFLPYLMLLMEYWEVPCAQKDLFLSSPSILGKCTATRYSHPTVICHHFCQRLLGVFSTVLVHKNINERHLKTLNLCPMGNVGILAASLILRQKWRKELRRRKSHKS